MPEENSTTHQEESILLNDGSVPSWDYHNHMQVKWYPGKTEFQEVIGIDRVALDVPGYSVFAVAQKTRNLVQRLNFENVYEPNNNPIQEEVIFNGTFTALNLEGDPPLSPQDITYGRIWTASPDIVTSIGSEGLLRLILGNDSTEYQKRLAAIVRGYQKQEQDKHRRQSAAISSSFSQGKESTRRNPLSRFPRD